MNSLTSFFFFPSLTYVHCLWQVKIDCYMNGNFLLPQSETAFMFAYCMEGSSPGLED